MLVRFRVANHRSIRDEQELSLVASALKDSGDSLIDLPQEDFRLLRAVGMYGPNASGKSTVLDALGFMRDAVLESQRRWGPEEGFPRKPFLLDAESAGRPSEFEVEFLAEGTRYRYGFAADFEQVLEEWLYAYPEGRAQRWFVRDRAEEGEFTFGRSLAGENRTIQALTRPNSLFLSAAAQNNHPQLSPVYRWFANQLRVVDPDDRGKLQAETVQSLRNPAYRPAVESIIECSDLGVAGIEIRDEEVNGFATHFRWIDQEKRQQTLFDWTEVKPPTVPRIWLNHSTGHGQEVAFRFGDESRGTQALFGLAGAVVDALVRGGVLCVDELDTSLHPLLALAIVQLFNDPKRNVRNAQLVFNTHDVQLLDRGILRRDQIWFTDKPNDGATRLYPLTDYRARAGENLRGRYLQGRYRAVPFIRFPEELLGTADEG